MNSAGPIALKAMGLDVSALAPTDIDPLLDILSPYKSITLGVSGGADSLALLFLVVEWKKRQSWSGALDVVTVDHGLRAESAKEARFVSDICRSLQVRHTILEWRPEGALSNLQGRAREARYALIAEHMEESSSEALVLGHHLDDQAETFLDRLTRGSGVYGLSAMASVEHQGPNGLQIVRPLLSLSKDQLVLSLEARGQSWVEDQSNEVEAYKRVRLRKLLKGLSDEGLSRDGLAETAKRMRRAREALEEWVSSFWSTRVTQHPAGPLAICFDAWQNLPLEMRLRVLSQALSATAGMEYPSRLSKLEALEADLQKQAQLKKTMSGCIVSKTVRHLLVWKEVGRSEIPSVGLAKFMNGCRRRIWDGRFEITLEDQFGELGDAMSIGQLITAPKPEEEFADCAPWPKEAFRASLAIYENERLLLVPGLYANRNRNLDGLKIQIVGRKS
ncbi:tRNA(ile)-lysidine synthase [Roseibium sp. TrichSKD4]|uniref:tRNA lysidine(34) synthetase TilS n=1 Tax=Roseibium sp. TrichSKD4 TaxID=744980 RepID=UPI0001E56D8D|nr:tRNA lysidine(34) synthetase TilS [Roseibium sp. TrichSKD4]EFO31519.1 tRNA(ile)-lysidine synthase [Roseibium sp. TrichSKD4]